MRKMWKMIATAGLLGVTLAFAGCGDDNDSKYDKKTTDVPATVSGQSATVTTATPVVTKDDQTVLTLPVGAVLTATAGTMPQQLSILVRTPDNGRTSGVPSKAGFELDDAAGAVDVSIPGVTAFTVTPGVNVVIPVENATGLAEGTPVPVTRIKADGTSSELTGTYSAANKTVTVANVTDFCWFIANPKWVQSGSTTTSSSTSSTSSTTTTTTTTAPTTTTTSTTAPTTTSTAPTTTTTTTTTTPVATVTISGAGSDDASAADKTYRINVPTDGIFVYTIDNFGTGDKIVNETGKTGVLDNISYTDFTFDIVYNITGTKKMTVRVGRLTQGQEWSLGSLNDLNTPAFFGPGTYNTP